MKKSIILSIAVILVISPFGIIGQSSAEISSEQIKNTLTKVLDWIKTHQNPDGSWGDKETAVIDTLGTLDALQLADERDSYTYYNRAVEWFNLTFPDNNAYVAKKLIVLIQAGEEVGSLDDFLAAQINERRYGFGFMKLYSPDPVTTAQVFKALTLATYQDPGSDPNFTINAILNYFRRSQNSDGGWPLVENSISSIFATLMVLEAIQPYYAPSSDQDFKTQTEKALFWLQNRQSEDGKFENLTYTAFAYKVLRSFGIIPQYYSQGIDYMLQSQDENGGFGDVYTTAMVISALY